MTPDPRLPLYVDLYMKNLKRDLDNPDDPDNGRIILRILLEVAELGLMPNFNILLSETINERGGL